MSKHIRETNGRGDGNEGGKILVVIIALTPTALHKLNKTNTLVTLTANRVEATFSCSLSTFRKKVKKTVTRKVNSSGE
jgi:hypothetical protein